MPTPAVPERPSPSHPRLLPKVTCKGLDPSRSADLASESPGAIKRHSSITPKPCGELSEFSRRTETETLLGNKSQLAEFASSSLMLISFEVFNGAEYDWLPHLDAVTTVLSMHSPEALLGPANSTDAAKASEEHVSNDNQPQPGLEFLMVHAIWFDILSCISTGRVPQISYRRWLETSKLEMADLMGCYNWVMIAIGDLAHLQAWKTDMKEKGTLSVPDLVMRSKEVDTRLQNGIDELEMSIKGNTKAPRAAWVSHIFALASLVLSSTIVSGPWASLPEIKDSVGKAVDDVWLILSTNLSSSHF
ncbi:uncharacterized protein N7487_003852 [Penicillium crustosum]|uniref:uncharacterized protein n=1 Tax=Penicillium crustosum TaxID=36656 RepID=UPI002392F59C|nr:uncharacterized protein N7487_003852 [Penicillium crustosum]KAJ5409493.1 hypothetical protein N7487_003852 [Penicillium crustosum]